MISNATLKQNFSNIVTGFEKVIGSSQETCSYDGQIGVAILDTDVLTCHDECESDPACMYFFFHENDACQLFSTCTKRRETSNIGVTYQRAQGSLFHILHQQ